MADPDWDDPCAVAAWLKPQLPKIAVGQGVVSIRHGDEQTTFSNANYAALAGLYRTAVSECAKKNGSRIGRRRAFIAR
jgi:hypothetical protein